MYNLASLRDSLYQQFFTGKGSLLFELVSSVHNSGETWELSERKGKLYLKGESDLALVYALYFLKNLTPQDALGFIGIHKPRYALRAITLKNIPEITHEWVNRILEWGFNAVVGDFTPDTLKKLREESYPLKFMPLVRSGGLPSTSRDKTFMDEQIEELQVAEALHSELVFYTEEPASFSELNFLARKSFLSFYGENVWEYLAEEMPFGTPLLPLVRGCGKELSHPVLMQHELSKTLAKMIRHPYAGVMVETPSLPEKNSFHDANLYAAGFSQFVDRDPLVLTRSWFKKNNPSVWIEEAIDHFDALARFIPKEGCKTDRQKILADVACIEERWPHTIYSSSAQKFV